VSVTGIPIHPVFAEPKDRGECLRKHGLRGDRPVVLQLAGGFGVGPIEQLYRAVLSVETPIEVVVVAGKNEQAKRQVESVEVPSRHRAKVMGFTTEIDELMEAADVVVSKPGGLTTSEVLARGAAMVIVNPIPGQESRNSDFLLENGAAIKVNNTATLPLKLSRLLSAPRRLEASARRLARPRAAFNVATLALEYASGDRKPAARARGRAAAAASR
jgi:processive 1,2-diacylglycerol beta-glucosyltransferase